MADDESKPEVVAAPDAAAADAEDKPKRKLPQKPEPEVIKPDSAEFDAQRKQIDDAIEAINVKMAAFTAKVKAAEEVKAGIRTTSGEKNAAAQKLRKQIDEVKARKQALFDESGGAGSAERKRRIDELKKVCGRYETVEAVDRIIREKESQIVSGADLKTEKALIAEINKMNTQIKPSVAQLAQLKEEQKAFQEKSKDTRGARDEVSAQLGALIEQDKKLRASKKGDDDKYKEADKAITESKKGKAELYQEILKKKAEKKEVDAKEAEINKDYDKYKRAMERYKRALDQERYQAEYEERAAERAKYAAEKQAEQDALVPWEEDVNTCDFLIENLQKMAGITVDEEDKTEKAEADKTRDLHLPEGNVLVRKDEDHEDNCFFVAGGGKKKKNKSKAKKVAFKIDTTIMSSFNNLKMNKDVPLTAADVPKAVAALQAKKEWYAGEEGKKAWKAKLEGKKERSRDREGGSNLLSVKLDVTGANAVKVKLTVR